MFYIYRFYFLIKAIYYFSTHFKKDRNCTQYVQVSPVFQLFCHMYKVNGFFQISKTLR